MLGIYEKKNNENKKTKNMCPGLLIYPELQFWPIFLIYKHNWQKNSEQLTKVNKSIGSVNVKDNYFKSIQIKFTEEIYFTII